MRNKCHRRCIRQFDREKIAPGRVKIVCIIIGRMI